MGVVAVGTRRYIDWLAALKRSEVYPLHNSSFFNDEQIYRVVRLVFGHLDQLEPIN
jgi:hypothetical protein